MSMATETARRERMWPPAGRMCGRDVLAVMAAFFLLAAVADASLPGCCQVTAGIYDESATALSSNVAVVCSNCGLPSLGVFAALQTLSASLSLTCTNCANLTTLGSFPALTAVSAPVSLVCSTCPALLTLGSFAAVAVLNGALTSSCTTCASLAAMADLPALANITGQGHVAVACTNCASLPAMAVYPSLMHASTSFAGPFLSATCSNCAALAAQAIVPALTSLTAPADASYTSLYVACSACPLLLSQANFTSMVAALPGFPSLTVTCTSCASLVSQATLPLVQDGNVQISCTNCAAIAVVGSLPSYSYGSSTIACTSCPSVQQLGIQPAWTVSGHTALSCTDCPLLQTMGTFPANLAANDYIWECTCTRCASVQSICLLPGLVAGGVIALACTDCPSLQQFAVFPWVTGVYSFTFTCNNCTSLATMGAFPKLTFGGATLACTGCPALTALGSFPALIAPTSLPTSAAYSISCVGCPALQGVGLPSTLPLSSGLSWTVSCINCPAFANLTAPVMYAFATAPPLTAPGFCGAGLQLANLTMTDAQFAQLMAPASSLTSLVLANVTGLTTADALLNVATIASASVTGCVNLVNADALAVTPVSASSFAPKIKSSVVLASNPSLCISAPVLQYFTGVTASISNNAIGSCGVSAVAAPSSLSAVPAVTSVYLQWTNPREPSVLVPCSLTLNGNPVASFYPALSATGSFTFSGLSPGTPYAVAIYCLLGSAFASTSLTVTTLSAFCAVAQYAVGTHCFSCPAGTYANATSLASSQLCGLCASGSRSSAPAQTACAPCAPGSFCPAGASTPLSAPINSTAPVLTGFAADGTAIAANAPVGLGFGYVYVIVFVVVWAVSLPLLFFLRRWLKDRVNQLALLLRTSALVLHLDSRDPAGQGVAVVRERRSYVRGVFGLWVALAVVLVTAYQIENFALNEYATVSSVQPGAVYASGALASATTTSIQLTVTIISTPATCDATLYPATLTLPRGSVTPACVSGAASLTYTANVAAASFATQGAVGLTVASSTASLVYFYAVTYTLRLDSFRGESVVLNQTLAASGSAGVLGGATIQLAAAPSEYIDASGVSSHGYTYSVLDQHVAETAAPGSSALVAFEFTVPQYVFQVREVQNISGLAFVTSVVAIAGGVVALGSALSLFVLLLHRRWTRQAGAALSANAISLDEK